MELLPNQQEMGKSRKRLRGRVWCGNISLIFTTNSFPRNISYPSCRYTAHINEVEQAHEGR